VLPQSLGWQNAQGNVLGVYLHGLFEDAAVLEQLFGGSAGQQVRTLDMVFDGLADFAQAHFAPSVLDGLLQPRV
jgi:adenosylcobyric acid synthase